MDRSDTISWNAERGGGGERRRLGVVGERAPNERGHVVLTTGRTPDGDDDAFGVHGTIGGQGLFCCVDGDEAKDQVGHAVVDVPHRYGVHDVDKVVQRNFLWEDALAVRKKQFAELLDARLGAAIGLPPSKQVDPEQSANTS